MKKTLTVLTAGCALFLGGTAAVAVDALATPDSGRPSCNGGEFVGPGTTTDWCDLTPGKGSSTKSPVQGRLTLSADGTSLVAETNDTSEPPNSSTGTARTSYICIYPAPVTDKRLQETQCAAYGGEWIVFTGGTSGSIDLAGRGITNGDYIVQIASNPRANNGNGDAFYNTTGITVGGTPVPLGAVGALGLAAMLGGGFLFWQYRRQRSAEAAL
jgi:hypothetical protein